MTHQNQYPHNTEDIERLGLTGALTSFEGTPMVPFIGDALAGAGIDPRTYDPTKYGHVNYRDGLLVDTLSPHNDDGVAVYAKDGVAKVSPIVLALETALGDGRIVVSKVPEGTARFHPWARYPRPDSLPFEPNAERTSKLSPIGMLELRDAQTGKTIAYAPKLSADGGRPGRAIVSVRDVIVNEDA